MEVVGFWGCQGQNVALSHQTQGECGDCHRYQSQSSYQNGLIVQTYGVGSLIVVFLEVE